MSVAAVERLLAVFLASGLAYEAPRPAPVDSADTLEGAPLLLWQTRLPGEPPNTATRTEPAPPVVDERYVYVGYSGVNALLVLDRRDGALVTRLPTNAPVASAPVLAGDFVYVSDSANQRVVLLDPSQPMIARLTELPGKGTFLTPWGIAVDGTGRVFVVDSGNNRVRMLVPP